MQGQELQLLFKPTISSNSREVLGENKKSLSYGKFLEKIVEYLEFSTNPINVDI